MGCLVTSRLCERCTWLTRCPCPRCGSNQTKASPSKVGHSPSAGGGKGEATAMFPRLHSFCIGLEDSPDLAAAKKVADYLGTAHHACESAGSLS